MDNMIKQNFNVDKKYTLVIFENTLENGETYNIFVPVETFKEMFAEPIQKAIDNNTDPMDEIRAFDPENKLGYNNLIV